VGTDKDWEKWGATDPYFGVLSDERYRRGQLDPTALEAFFRSGDEDISRVLERIRTGFAPDFAPRSALDFGSGVGRLVIPLARRVERVVGVDISTSMIAEARRNCAAAGVDNVEFVLSDDTLSRVQGTFDLVYTNIVLPHIDWARGRVLLQELGRHVAPGGFLAAQFLVRCTASPLARSLARARYALPPLHWARNVLRGRPLLEPAMQLHVYDPEVVRADLRERGFSEFSDVLAPPAPGLPFESLFLVAHRSPSAEA
jgi:SAM-dependent methyltransferase